MALDNLRFLHIDQTPTSEANNTDHLVTVHLKRVLMNIIYSDIKYLSKLGKGDSVPPADNRIKKRAPN